MDKVKVCIFCGGRGSSNIIRALMEHPQIELYLLINAYDDGLSTGRLRAYVPGMLGPSDIRKNISHLMNSKRLDSRCLGETLDYRYPDRVDIGLVLRDLNALANMKLPETQKLSNWFKEIPWKQYEQIKHYINAFVAFYESQIKINRHFDFGDCSLGNILFAGCFLHNGSDFNRTIDDFAAFCSVSGKVYNITKGENLVLVGLKRDGQYLARESDIVGPDSKDIEEIYLLADYLSEQASQELAKLDKQQKKDFLAQRQIFPEINPETVKAIREADVIIYGPGTQYSSLLPSYLTIGVSEAIAGNQSAQKIFVSNIIKDHDIQYENANSLVQNLLFYLHRKNQANVKSQALVNNFFFQKQEDVKMQDNYLPFDSASFPFALEDVRWLDWESEQGKHSMGLIFDEILSIIQNRLSKKIKSNHHLVSIVVPGLNEVATVGKVLHELNLLNFLPYNLEKEIIYVDGGSNDGSYEVAQKEIGVKCYQMTNCRGRGEAIRYGLEKAKGNILVVFPSDNEYRVNDVYRVIAPINNNEARVVFGSRSIKCLNLNRRILNIYHGKIVPYLISKYGGMLLSVSTLILYNRYISDTLTSLKAFHSSIIRNNKFECNGVDFDMETIAKVSGMEEYILEIPVEFSPRTKDQGKKISLKDGLDAIWALIAGRFKLGNQTQKVMHERTVKNTFSDNTRV